MRRFSGWTQAAVKKLGRLSQQREQKLTKKTTNTPDYVGQISAALNIMGIKHEREYKFLHDRRFRFDIALPEIKLAIEFEGGIFANGAHTRGKHYASDAKKYNLATMHDWKLLRYTSEDTKNINWEFEIAMEIKNLIEGINDQRTAQNI